MTRLQQIIVFTLVVATGCAGQVRLPTSASPVSAIPSAVQPGRASR